MDQCVYLRRLAPGQFVWAKPVSHTSTISIYDEAFSLPAHVPCSFHLLITTMHGISSIPSANFTSLRKTIASCRSIIGPCSIAMLKNQRVYILHVYWLNPHDSPEKSIKSLNQLHPINSSMFVSPLLFLSWGFLGIVFGLYVLT